MKRISAFTVMLILLCTIFPSFTCHAMNAWLDTEERNEDIERISENMDIKTVEPPTYISCFDCFDVKDNGDYILGRNSDERNYIYVYNASGEYRYGLSVYASESFGVQWDNENIIYYSVRGDIAVLIDKSGNILEIESIKDTIENNSTWNHLVFADERKSGNNTYKAETGIFLSSHYSKLTKVDKDGNETVLFDNTRENCIVTIVLAVIILSFSVSIITYIAVHTKKSIKNNRQRMQ